MLAHTSHAANPPKIAVIVAGAPRTFVWPKVHMPLASAVELLGAGSHAFVVLKLDGPPSEALLVTLEPALEALNSSWGSPFVEAAQQSDDVRENRRRAASKQQPGAQQTPS